MEEPVGQAAALGVKLHKQLEDWCKDPTKVPEHPAAKAALVYGHPGEGVLPELKVEMLEAGGVPVRGRIDLLFPPLPGVGGFIRDWKTTSSVPGGSLDLLEGVQMPCYARSYFERYPDEIRVFLQHVYLSTKKPGQTRMVTQQVTRAEVGDRWRELAKLVPEMKQVASATDPEQVRANTDVCDNCPRAKDGTCSAANTKGSKSKMGIFKGIKAKKLEDESKITPPDVPESGETGPKADPLEAEAPTPEPKKRGRPKKQPEQLPLPGVESRVFEVRLQRTVNLGDYENVKLELASTVPEGQDYKDVATQLSLELQEFAQAMKKS